MKAAATKTPTPYDLFTRAELDMWIRGAIETERERCARAVESVREVSIPEPFRNCGLYGDNEKDGWRTLNADTLGILRSVAASLRKPPK